MNTSKHIISLAIIYIISANFANAQVTNEDIESIQHKVETANQIEGDLEIYLKQKNVNAACFSGKKLQLLWDEISIDLKGLNNKYKEYEKTIENDRQNHQNSIEPLIRRRQELRARRAELLKVNPLKKGVLGSINLNYNEEYIRNEEIELGELIDSYNFDYQELMKIHTANTRPEFIDNVNKAENELFDHRKTLDDQINTACKK